MTGPRARRRIEALRARAPQAPAARAKEEATPGLAAFVLASMAALAAAGPAAAQRIELALYRQESQEGVRRLAAEFEGEHPGIKVSVVSVAEDPEALIASRAAQGRLPDLVQLQSYRWLRDCARRGWLVDLSRQPVLGKVIDAAKPAVSDGGRLWALPMDYDGIGIIYDKALFARLRLRPPTTFPELERLCKALRDRGLVPFAGMLASDWSIGQFLSLVHTSLLAERGIETSQFIADMDAGRTAYGAAGAERLFAIMDFYRANMAPNAVDMDWNEQQADFAAGRAAMMVQGLWSYKAALAANPKLDAGFCPFPVSSAPSAARFYADVDSCVGVSSQSPPERRAAALEFLEWLATPKARGTWTKDCGLASVFKGADQSSLGGPYVELLAAAARRRVLPWAFASYPAAVYEEACKRGASQYVLGRKGAGDVLAEIDRRWAAEFGRTAR